MMKSTVATLICLFAPSASGFAFVNSSARSAVASNNVQSTPQRQAAKSSSSSLSMVDPQVLMGGGIAVAGLVTGVGALAFFENMGNRAEERGGGLSGDMATRITGGLMEDVEVDTVSDLTSLTDKLEAALKETGGADEAELAMNEEDKQRMIEDAEDGW